MLLVYLFLYFVKALK